MPLPGTPAAEIARLRGEDVHLLAWNPGALRWELTYRDLQQASASGYPAAADPIGREAATRWADSILGPRHWTPVGSNAAWAT